MTKNKWFSILLCLSMVFMVACNNKNTDNNTLQTDPLQSNGENVIDDLQVDKDLSSLSDTMLYAELSYIIMYPEDYIGKTIKIKGELFSFQNQVTGATNHAVVISDATACCVQGLEFKLKDTERENMPKDGEEITVAGEFEIYQQNNMMFARLKDACIVS